MFLALAASAAAQTEFPFAAAGTDSTGVFRVPPVQGEVPDLVRPHDTHRTAARSIFPFEESEIPSGNS